MKSILISIKPKWVAKILNGKKTIEIRRNMPKCDLPIDVYIYCTKDRKQCLVRNNINKTYHLDTCYWDEFESNLNGKVVARFWCDKVEEINRYCTGRGISYKTKTLNDIELCDKSCLDLIEIDHYLYFKKGYAWHIDNLVIFDKPKELSEFGVYHKVIYLNYPLHSREFVSLKRPPQSFMYIEVEER